jgi:hypothetical protein
MTCGRSSGGRNKDDAVGGCKGWYRWKSERRRRRKGRRKRREKRENNEREGKRPCQSRERRTAGGGEHVDRTAEKAFDAPI